MDYFGQVPPECLDVLRKAGWSDERHVDISQKASVLERSGWFIFPLAQRVLESVDGLSEIGHPLIHPGLNGFEFNCLAGEFDHDQAQDWESRHQKTLYPLGRLHDLYMLLDQDGLIYATDSHEIIFCLGTSVEACFRKLMFFGHRVVNFSPLIA